MAVVLTFFFAAPIALLLAGCREAPPSPGQQSQQFRRADRGEALLAAAAAQLADLPAAVDTRIRPPAVILDSTKSSDGQDVYAVCTAHPSMPDGPINFVYAPAENGRFRSLGVRSGDILKYFLLEDQTVDEERRQAGLARQLPMDFTIAQVIDENTLLIEKGVPPAIVRSYLQQQSPDAGMLPDDTLPQSMPIPAKIEIWRNLDDRLEEIRDKLTLYAERRLPPVGWEPSPDEQVINQIMVWLNQWLRQSEPKTEWDAGANEQLLHTLPEELRAFKELAPFLDTASLSADRFQPYDELQPQDERTMRDSHYDGRLLQEAIWLRDISRWAQGEHFNSVARAGALFDWTVRNVHLVADDAGRPHRPWQTLLHGRGTAEQRAWVFALLARQQGLDVVILQIARPSADDQQPTADSRQPTAAPTFWLPALVEADQLYLFDTRLGLAIPGPGGEGVATLEHVRAEESLLRALDLDDASYPITADDLNHVVACVVAGPFDLSRRAWQLESRLTGDDHVVLTSHVGELADRLRPVSGLTDVRLWAMPFRALRDQLSLGRSARHREALAFEPFAVRPVLWKARVRHFQGRRFAGESAHAEPVDDHREAAQLYTSKSVRPTDREIARTTSAERRRIEATAKLNATYWVALLSFDEGRYDVAAQWLGRPELRSPDSPWSAAARYNLARSLEAQENYEDAIALLDADDSPQQHGNRLRARELKSRMEEANDEE